MTETFHLISGAGGGGKKGGSGGGGGVESPNNLRSKQVAKVIDLISEGPIVGLVDGPKSVTFDGVQAVSDDGTINFSDASLIMEIGLPDQPVLPGFAAQQAETQVGSQLKTTLDIVRTVLNADVDRVRITVSTPNLSITNTENGNTRGSRVDFEIFVQSNGGGYQSFGVQTISGKTTSRFQRAYVIALAGSPPWDIRLHRITPDSVKLANQNDLYWDSYTEIIDAKINYNSSAVIAVTVDAEQFNAIPKRVYECYGREIQVPSNYDPEARTYDGVWDGTFQIAYTANPAWIFYDLVTNTRYGLGQWIAPAQVDKWSLYSIGQFCDAPVSDGKGGLEPRFECNVWITERQEAFDLLQSLASVFRGFTYWSGGQMIAVSDMPTDPAGQFTNADVIDGLFTYAGADIKARHNMANVTWNDPANLGEPRISIVEDQDSISAKGIIATDVTAIGAISEAQAIRVGKWTLFTELYESELVTFQIGLGGAWAHPGEVVRIMDRTRAGLRRGGRVAASDTRHVTLDAPIEFVPGEEATATISVYVEDDDGRRVQTTGVADLDATGRIVTTVDLMISAPTVGSTWVITSGELDATLWRVVSVKEVDGKKYEISALRHRPDKWSVVEDNMILADPVTSTIGTISPVTNLKAIDYLVALSAISVGSVMTISWTSLSPAFDVDVRPVDGNNVRTRVQVSAIDIPVSETDYEIGVTPINSLGQRGTTVKLTHTVIGTSAPPTAPANLRIQVVSGVALFAWQPSRDLDVLIGGSFEMRYSPNLSGVNWTSANTVLQSIPGTATSVELPYRPGTYLLRSKDIAGLLSTEAAVIVAGQIEPGTQNFFRIEESPDWPGVKANVEVQPVSDWLILGDSGGTIDGDTDLIDDWPDFDVLPFEPDGETPIDDQVGVYEFDQGIDLGAVFVTRLTVDMLAFPLSDADVPIDDRIGNVDDWQSWDDPDDDLSGAVHIQVRQTDDDPAGTPTWSDWTLFTSSSYEARAFQFRAILTAPIGENVAIESLAITADISNKVDQGSDVAWIDPKMTIAYNLKFYLVPSVSILIQEGVTGDIARVTNKTTTSFDLEILNGGVVVTADRTFDWIASGY